MYNILADIIATASILIKFGHDDILENQRTFVAFLNELGFKTVEGRPITLTNLFNMTQDITIKIDAVAIMSAKMLYMIIP